MKIKKVKRAKSEQSKGGNIIAQASNKVPGQSLTELQHKDTTNVPK